MRIPDADVKDKNKTSLTFTFLDGTPSQTVSLRDAISADEYGNNVYKFECLIPPKDIGLQVIAQLNLSDGEMGVRNTFSISDYVKKLETEESDSLNSDKISPLQNVVDALVDYGNVSNEFFSGSNNIGPDPERDAVTVDKIVEEIAEEKDSSEIVKPELPKKPAATDNKKVTVYDKVNYYGSSLLLKDETTLRHYFTLADGVSADDITVKSGSHTLTLTQKLDSHGNPTDFYYVDFAGITANDLAKSKEVTVTATGATGEMTIKYSPMSYVYTVLSDKNADSRLTALCKSLYVYNQTAKAYAKTLKK